MAPLLLRFHAILISDRVEVRPRQRAWGWDVHSRPSERTEEITPCSQSSHGVISDLKDVLFDVLSRAFRLEFCLPPALCSL